ncbi:hypothetical protein [Streptomyces achromogenes]|uniref:hypothetical protein n=1 Tax=Streptomyces achromogenes TaxID=67255 RepID=UPI0036F8909F
MLFAHPRGCAPAGPAADPAAVPETFPRLLGISGDRIPCGATARSASCRQLPSGISALVVLGEAADAEQARPLLPPGTVPAGHRSPAAA